MLARNRDDLVCDLAETYGIYDMRSLPVSTLATLAVGLREESRTKMKRAGTTATKQDLLLAAAVDRLSTIIWALFSNGQGKPKSILNALLGMETDSKEYEGFDTAESFEDYWESITGVRHGKI